METKNRSEYLPRLIDRELREVLSTFGAVCIEGPKWCGKTWTAESLAGSAFYVGDPDGNYKNRSLAEMAPSVVLKGTAPRLIDEWQEVGALWDAVRFAVDQSGEKGKFILTGSATPSAKGVLHTGTGRIETVRMRPMSLYESGVSNGSVSLSGLFDGAEVAGAAPAMDLEGLVELAVRGGWPGGIGLPFEKAARIPRAYIKAVLERDLKRLSGPRRNVRKFGLLLRSLARNVASTVSVRRIGEDIRETDEVRLDAETIAAYLEDLERLFLIDNQRPFALSLRSSDRVKKAEKRHFVDPSLAVALLGATKARLMDDLNTFGFIFESLCVRDLRIYAEAAGGTLSHYQDYAGREIDAVVELRDGRWGAFEIKLGFNQVDAAAAGLVALNREIAAKGGKPAAVSAVVCGLCEYAFRRPDGVYVIPITALKP